MTLRVESGELSFVLPNAYLCASARTQLRAAVSVNWWKSVKASSPAEKFKISS
jgi:hypothetical protein